MEIETSLLQALSLLDDYPPPRPRSTSTSRRRKRDHDEPAPKTGMDSRWSYSRDGISTHSRNCTDKNTYTTIHHSYQLEPWDCGLASLVMIARWLRLDSVSKRTEDENKSSISSDPTAKKRYTTSLSSSLSVAEMEERQQVWKSIGTTSIWTADLVWELHKWKVQRRICSSSLSSSSSLPASSVSSTSSLHPFLYAFVTKNLGVDDDYREVGYYQHELEVDKRRITRKFQELTAWGSPMILSSSPPQPSSSSSSSVMLLSPEAGTTPILSLSALEEGGGPISNNITAVDDVTTNNELSLSLVASILEHNEDCVAITLLDNHILCQRVIGNKVIPPRDCHDHENDKPNLENTTNRLGDGTSKDTVIEDGSSYAGHYVILCGISRNPHHLKEAQDWEDDIRSVTNRLQQLSTIGDDANGMYHIEEDFCFVLSNPAPSTPAPFMFITPHRLEASWRAKGTDEDIIFIRKCSC
jgi:hypothetical protein